jgi:hypothetical protein
MRIGPVQGVGLAAPGIGHTQHPAKQLLDIGRALDAGNRTEHIGEGAVPALFQRLDRDDVFDPALGIEEIDAVEFALIACRDGDPLLGDLLDFDEVLLQLSIGAQY